MFSLKKKKKSSLNNSQYPLYSGALDGILQLVGTGKV